MTRRGISTDGAAAAVGPYSQGAMATPGRIVFTAGQIGADPSTGKIVPGGVLTEFDRAMKSVSAILEAAGGSLSDVVKTTVYFRSLDDFAAVNARYASWFDAPFPARTSIQAAALPLGAAIEVEAVAVLGS